MTRLPSALVASRGLDAGRDGLWNEPEERPGRLAKTSIVVRDALEVLVHCG
jgi:hypothetical protein